MSVLMLSAVISEDFGASGLKDALEGSARTAMDAFDPLQTMDIGDALNRIFLQTVQNQGDLLLHGIRAMGVLLLILVLCKLVECLWEMPSMPVSTLAGALAVSLTCFGDVRTYLGLGTQTMEEMNVFSAALLPVMASAAAASGSANQAGAVYGLTVGASHLFQQLCSTLLLPMLYAYLAIALGDTVLGQPRFKRLRELLAGAMKSTLKLILTGFVGLLGATGALSGAADSAALKTAKAAISGMVPVVGGILANASEALLTGAGLVKATAGTFGMVAIFAIFLLPFLRIGVYYAAMKWTSVLGAMIDSRLCELLESISSAMGFLLAMTGSGAILNVISCCCYLKMVTT